MRARSTHVGIQNHSSVTLYANIACGIGTAVRCNTVIASRARQANDFENERRDIQRDVESSVIFARFVPFPSFFALRESSSKIYETAARATQHRVCIRNLSEQRIFFFSLHGVHNLFRSSLGRFFSRAFVVKNLREMWMRSRFIVSRIIAFSISKRLHKSSRKQSARRCNCNLNKLYLKACLFGQHFSLFIRRLLFQAFSFPRDAYDPRVSPLLS